VADHLANAGERGCALANAAIELPDKSHPARPVIENYKIAQRNRLIDLCERAGLTEPEMLADELHFLLEGARVAAQSVSADGLGARLTRMGEAMSGPFWPFPRAPKSPRLGDCHVADIVVAQGVFLETRAVARRCRCLHVENDANDGHTAVSTLCVMSSQQKVISLHVLISRLSPTCITLIGQSS